MEKLPNATTVHRLRPLRSFMVRTDYEAASGAWNGTLFVAFECSAREIATEQGACVLVDADHVQVVIPGELWDVVEVPVPATV